MAAAAVAPPPSNYHPPGSHLPSTLQWPQPPLSSPDSVDPDKIASEWTEKFNLVLDSKSASFEHLLSSDCYWRDLLCLSWDFRTLHGPHNIHSFVEKALYTCKLQVDASKEYKKPQLVTVAGCQIVQTFLKAETNAGQGEGLVRLVRDNNDGNWKAFTIFTTLKELKGYEENTHTRRPSGNDRDPAVGGMNWKDRRNAQLNFEGDREPVVLIIGRSICDYQSYFPS